MCQTMVNIQSPTAEIRQRKKRRKKQHEIYMVCPITQGDHKLECYSRICLDSMDENDLVKICGL